MRVIDDKTFDDCRSRDNSLISLPPSSYLPFNRCNLPAFILGSLTFQRYPAELTLDGVAELHAVLFRRLDQMGDTASCAILWRDYVARHFCFGHLEDAGLDPRPGRQSAANRAKANWMRMLRGWSFDADGREGAVLKGWVESRFGLLPRFHKEPLRDAETPAYQEYLRMRAAGLYGTNALEAQLDLLYAYCQYEFRRESPGSHLILYRGVNRLAGHEVLAGEGPCEVVLFNNLTSFTAVRERADEFGDCILEVRVPTAKVFFHHRLLPGVLKGEAEYLVIGGAYRVRIHTM
ncbi:MAG: NAD(+)--dinitrogen-reductase ADP-D-ribosyltransferase [Pseudomonadota bacterium]